VFCPTCATPLDPALKFCPKCGQPAPVVSTPQSVAQPLPAAISRPAGVKLAGNLLFAAIALNFLGTIYAYTIVARSSLPMVGRFVPSALILVIWIVVILQMLEGKSWARIGVMVGIVWSAVVVLTTLRFLRYGVQFGTLGLSWISFALRLYAGYLLFRPENNAWFR
jgi:hypothetical protein